MSERIPVARPSFGEAEEKLVVGALRSGWVTQGPRVADFERQFAARVGAPEAVAVSSGTASLFLSLHALGVGAGDEVIVPSLTFIASVNVIVHCGAEPVFVDVEPGTCNVDPAAVREALTSRTRAVMAVHQLGFPADLDGLEAAIAGTDVVLIEDAACAIGSRLDGRAIGGSGRPTCFSFHPRKLIVTGEGGMITTADGELAARLRRLRHQGMSVSDLDRDRADHVVIESYPEIGFNYRLSDLHAAVGLAQLEKLDHFLDRRRALAARYDGALREIDALELPRILDGSEPNYQSYIVCLAGAEEAARNRLMNALDARGVATRRGLMAVHQEAPYRNARVAGSLRHTEAVAAQSFLLPLYPDLTEAQQDSVISRLHEALAEAST